MSQGEEPRVQPASPVESQRHRRERWKQPRGGVPLEKAGPWCGLKDECDKVVNMGRGIPQIYSSDSDRKREL